jgi:DNA polymerase-1
MDEVKEQAKRDGFVETLFGRRRPMPDINSGNFVVRQAAERAAINMPIQGTEADLMKLAMIKVQDKLDKDFPDCYMLLQVHDSILVQCPENKSKVVAKMLQSTMESVYELPVKLAVDVSIGDNWGEL